MALVYQPKIGLEVHVQLNKLKTKLFCSCSTNYQGLPPNSNVCPVCLGLPGSLPVLNREAVRHALMVAKALNCSINTRFNFVRKNYFYPDMIKNFQISQYDKAGGIPIAMNGRMVVDVDGKTVEIRIRRIQIEEDPGRLEHPFGLGSSPYVLVDYNRAGMGLLEIVTEPDMKTSKEARAFINKLRSVLEHLDVCDTSLEGAMRADANISVNGGNRVEVKNISSYKEVEKAIDYEILRQTKILEEGGVVQRETRHWLEAKGVSVPSRAKEEEQDYRYFPEPDIPPVVLSQDFLNEVFSNMPELPDARVKRFVENYSLSKYDASVLVMEKSLADFFEETLKFYPKPKIVANWVIVEVLRQLNERKAQLKELPLRPVHLAELLKLMEDGTLSSKLAKRVLVEVCETAEPPSQIVKRLGLTRIADEQVIREIAKEVFKENPKAVEDAKKDAEAVNYLIGQVMKKTKGKADPVLTNKVVRELLSDL